jgi:hypothetical protein
MKPLFTEIELKKATNFDKLPCECYNCNKTFLVNKHSIMYAVRGTRNYAKFCSRQCKSESEKGLTLVDCLVCKEKFEKKPSEIKRTKNNFCSKSCAAKYNNVHKTHGTRRSKLEIYFEEQLKFLYPKLHIDYNKKEAINSELDIYIPSLKLAIELNGIFHYEPIYKNFKQTQNNDLRKFQACIERNIELCIIDISSQLRFTTASSYKFLNIITTIIDYKAGTEINASLQAGVDTLLLQDADLSVKLFG